MEIFQKQERQLCRFAELDLQTIIPLLHYTITPLNRYAVAPLYRYTVVPLVLYIPRYSLQIIYL